MLVIWEYILLLTWLKTKTLWINARCDIIGTFDFGTEPKRISSPNNESHLLTFLFLKHVGYDVFIFSVGEGYF